MGADLPVQDDLQGRLPSLRELDENVHSFQGRAQGPLTVMHQVIIYLSEAGRRGVTGPKRCHVPAREPGFKPHCRSSHLQDRAGKTDTKGVRKPALGEGFPPR